jgi:hypothetical protein
MFNVSAAPTLAITSPAAGTVWQAGTVGTMTWTAANMPPGGQVYVDLWKGGAYVRYLTHVPSPNGSNTLVLFLPPDLTAGADYRLRVAWTENVNVNALSPVFTVAPVAGFAITAPTSATIWQAGASGNLSFTATNLLGASQAYVHLWRSGAYVRYLGRVPCVQGANTVPLLLPAGLAAGPGYQLHMFWTENTNVRAFSQSFVVTPPPPALLLAVEGSDPQEDNETSTSGSSSQDP